MTRSVFVSSLLALFAVSTAAGEPPNIVYLLCDDLGYGDVRCLAPETSRIPTPHADRLASEGMIFTDAHSGSSVCTPTRYGILTGRHSWRTRLQKGVVTGYAPSLIASERPTVAGFLKDAGYDTAAIGKWHLDFLYLDPETEEPYAEKPDVVDELLGLLKADVARGRSTEGPESSNDVEEIALWKSGRR
ncbi:MAG: sulfatase-like hydrolase/transferase [Verrucomicrobiales bacterium]